MAANGTATTMLTITTTAPSALFPNADQPPKVGGRRSMSWVVAPLVMAVLILSLGRLFVLQGKQRRWGLVYGLVALALVLGCAGCGSGGVGGSGGGGGNTNPGTPVGTYTITVSFTINGVTETVPNLTVNVQ